MLSSCSCNKPGHLYTELISGAGGFDPLILFNCHFQDFGQCKQQIQVYADPFVVSMDLLGVARLLVGTYLFPDICCNACGFQRQSLTFNKSFFQRCFVNLKHNTRVQTDMCEATLEAQLKYHTKSA